MKKFYLLLAATLEIIRRDPYFEIKDYQLELYLIHFSMFQVLLLFMLFHFFMFKLNIFGFGDFDLGNWDNYAFILLSFIAFINVNYIKNEDINATRMKIEKGKHPKTFAYIFHIGVLCLHFLLFFVIIIVSAKLT